MHTDGWCLLALLCFTFVIQSHSQSLTQLGSSFPFLPFPSHIHTHTGTGGYLAPEIRQQRLYSESVDIWACGVLLYLLLSCRLPFNAEVEILPTNRQQVERKFELAFPEAIWKTRSESVKDLLKRMLATDPMRRHTANQVIRHPWIVYGPSADIVKKPGQVGNGGGAGGIRGRRGKQACSRRREEADRGRRDGFEGRRFMTAAPIYYRYTTRQDNRLTD